jgi:hypothetical protein
VAEQIPTLGLLLIVIGLLVKLVYGSRITNWLDRRANHDAWDKLLASDDPIIKGL